MGLGGRGERSDHEPFCDLGIPYVFFWTPDTHCYHATCDTVEHVDIRHMAMIADVAASLVTQLATTDQDLAASRAKLGCGQPTSKPHT
jgi:Zn-dependent M28 family amino/carboxypeptidase